MSDQAAGLRAWSTTDSLPLGIIGDPGEDALMQALATLPAPADRRWQAVRGEQRPVSGAWLLWVDVAQIDVTDLYLRVKRALPDDQIGLTLLLWLGESTGTRSEDARADASLDAAAIRLLANLRATLKRFLHVELTQDSSRWLTSLPPPVRWGRSG